MEPPPDVMVLPSPNGSTISAALADRVPTVLAACLRNASAVASWVAGAVLSTLVAGVDASPEARVAASAFDAVRPRLGAELRTCAGGRELIDGGWPGDVDIASELDTSVVVPVLVDGVFRPA